MVLTVTTDPAASVGTPLGTLELVDHASNQVISSPSVTAPASTGGWQQITLRPRVPETGRLVRLRLTAAGGTAFRLAAVEIPVDYGFQVVDLTEPLNAFNTHASIFDSHPNERAHRVIAEKVLDALQNRPPSH